MRICFDDEVGVWDVKCFKSILIARIKIARVYVTAALSGILAQIFFAFIKIFTISAFTDLNSAVTSPLGTSSFITYVWLTQAFVMMQPLNVDNEDINSIRTGSIVYELARPVDLFGLLFIKTFALRFTNSMIRAVPIITINVVLFPLLGLESYSIVVSSVSAFLLFLFSMIASYFVSTLITVFIYAITLHTVNASNFIGLLNSMAFFLSGTLLPLSYFPEFMQNLLMVQPFKSVIDTPAMILSGQYTFVESFLFISLQIAWIIVLFCLCSLLFRKGMKKIMILGG